MIREPQRPLRIAVLAEHAREAGGVETYLSDVIPELARRGHAVALVAAHDAPRDRAPIPTPPDALRMTLDAASVSHTVAALREWQPDILYVHGIEPGTLDDGLRSLAPVAWFAHDYRATCVSGFKTWQAIGHRTCTRPLGTGCLAYYYPARCGGLNPITMMHDLRRARARLTALQHADAVVTHSRHMASELERNGIAPTRIHRVPFCVAPLNGAPAEPPRAGETLRVAFVGRLDRLKGADHFVEALPMVRADARRAVEATLAGDGPERQHLATLADRVTDPEVRITFTGWLPRERLADVLRHMHAVAMPSLWPEPFGRVGLEAGSLGVPSVALAAGGIPDWLVDGINGYAVEPAGASTPALAEAIARVGRDEAEWRRLADGARAAAERFTVAAHVDALVPALRAVVA